MNYIDMLSILGAGSAHPGGFAATLRQLKEHPLPPRSRVLEVGCGTGRTACYLAEQGHRVTAVDIHPHMLEKAKKRSSATGAEIEFLQASASSLPFPSDSFDVIIGESVTNFTDACSSLAEYCRVLAKGGALYDRELMMHDLIQEEALAEIRRFFGIPRLYRSGEWLSMLSGSGFSQSGLADYRLITDDSKGEQFLYPDPHEIVDDNIFTNAALWQTASSHDRIIFDNAGHLSFGLLHAVK